MYHPAMKTTAILASGPSLTQADCDAVHAWRSMGANHCHTYDSDGNIAEMRTSVLESRSVIVVNTTFRAAMWADVLYTNDDDWLDLYIEETKDEFQGRVICGHPDWRGDDYVHHVPFDRDAEGLRSQKPGHIAWGMNSGGAAISLAAYLGARRIILLGYDQQWTGGEPRWHGRHPAGLQNQKPGFHRWAKWFTQAAIDADACGIQIVNASRATSLTCFPCVALEDALQ